MKRDVSLVCLELQDIRDTSGYQLPTPRRCHVRRGYRSAQVRLAWSRHVGEVTRNVTKTCRYYGISRTCCCRHRSSVKPGLTAAGPGASALVLTLRRIPASFPVPLT